MEIPNPATLHDMRTCLALGQTPDSPIYVGRGAEKATQVDTVLGEKPGITLLLADLFAEGHSHQRRMKTTLEETLQQIYRFIVIKTDFGLNPLSDMRKVFPGFSWTFHELTEDSGNDAIPMLVDSRVNYIWCPGNGYFTAYSTDCPGRFCCSPFIKGGELEEELQILSDRGYTLVNIP